MKSHSSKRPFVCDTCGYAAKLEPALQHHKRIHTGDRPFKCPMPGCGAAFCQQNGLTTHLRSHLKMRPYICTYKGCSYKSIIKSALKQHEKEVHSGVKDHQCEECSYVCSRRYHLMQHWHNWHSPEASQRQKVEESRIAEVLQKANISFVPNKYFDCRGLGGSFRNVDFVVYTDEGIICLEVGESFGL